MIAKFLFSNTFGHIVQNQKRTSFRNNEVLNKFFIFVAFAKLDLFSDKKI